MPKEVLCSECRRRPSLPIWMPIPRLGGKRKRVCRECTQTLLAQASLDDDAQLQREARGAVQVERAVAHRHLAAVEPPSFASPVDVADVAEDAGHPLATWRTA